MSGSPWQSLAGTGGTWPMGYYRTGMLPWRGGKGGRPGPCSSRLAAPPRASSKAGSPEALLREGCLPGAGLQGTALHSNLLDEPSRWAVLATDSREQKPSASASAFKTTEMSSLVELWSKYFGHLDTTFCACEIKCIINLAWPSDKVGRSDKYPGSRPREGDRIHIATK